MRASELHDRVVLDIDTAREVGRVAACILDPDASRIVGFRLGGASPVLALADVRAVGADAVTVEGEAVLRQPTDVHEQRAIELGLDPVGVRLLGDDGSVLGTTTDVEFDEDGTVRAVEVDGGQAVAGDRILGIGDYAMVVRA